jgi:hypothetical protein
MIEFVIGVALGVSANLYVERPRIRSKIKKVIKDFIAGLRKKEENNNQQ